VQSQLLRDYRATHNKRDHKWDLKQIYGHIVEFSGDQIGSRFLQQKLETANSDEKAIVFKELMPNAIQLMQDVFGNYVIQKFFEHGDQTQKRWLGEKMRNHIASLSLQMYACRVVQKAFEYVLADQQALLVSELHRPGLVIKCLECQHGNHVIQKAIEVIPLPHVRFIYDALFGHIGRFAEHTYGCRVVQRMLEQPDEDVRKKVLLELQSCGPKLIPDTFGNYVAQHVICHGDLDSKNWMIGLVVNDMMTFGRHKFASNVVEKCIEHGSDEQRRQIMEKVIEVNPNADPEESGLLGYLKDQYGNYVIRKLTANLHFGHSLVDCLDRNSAQVPTSSRQGIFLFQTPAGSPRCPSLCIQKSHRRR
jgi:mRNA-binding protein PUF3